MSSVRSFITPQKIGGDQTVTVGILGDLGQTTYSECVSEPGCRPRAFLDGSPGAGDSGHLMSSKRFLSRGLRFVSGRNLPSGYCSL